MLDWPRFREAGVKMKQFFLPFLLSSFSLWSMEEGILRLDQKVVPELILSDSPGAITVRYAIDSIKDIIHPVTILSERSSFESTSNEESAILTRIICQPIWAVDLSNTFMSSSDFKIFMREMLLDFSQLQVLVLSTVSLKDDSWNELLPLLSSEHFQYLDVCGTQYSNKRIVPILKRGKSYDSTLWPYLSLKLIFSNQTYYNQLKKEGQWIKSCVEVGELHRDWHQRHTHYYQTLDKKIKQAKALNLLSGDSDVDQEFEEDGSFDHEHLTSRLNQLSLQEII
jgi:hypothetical protein